MENRRLNRPMKFEIKNKCLGGYKLFNSNDGSSGLIKIGNITWENIIINIYHIVLKIILILILKEFQMHYVEKQKYMKKVQ